MEKVASYWNKYEFNHIRCILCPHRCYLKPGEVGKCRGKVNLDGQLIAHNYGKVVAIQSDPIEKKPLYHYFPGSHIISLGPCGCNLSCDFCQNAEISQFESSTQYINPEELAAIVAKSQTIGVAYTYTEPLIWFEYLMDCAPLVHKAGKKNVLVSNGIINAEPLQELIPFIDAINVDLKSFDAEFYRKFCNGFLKVVLQNIKELYNAGVWLELTNLVIPGLNDNVEEFKAMVDWIANVSPSIPLHISRYFPHYNRDNPPTPAKTLLQFYEIAKAKLNYVYVGNLLTQEGASTLCPKCSNLLIERLGYTTRLVGLKDGKCLQCDKLFDGKLE